MPSKSKQLRPVPIFQTPYSIVGRPPKPLSIKRINPVTYPKEIQYW